MRVSRKQAEANRDATIAAASRLFRQHGYDGIGIAGLMDAVGQTHGAFYKQFESKEDLLVHAVAQALGQTGELQAKRIEDDLGGITELIQGYLSPDHRDRIEDGCPFSALACDAARRGPEVRQVMEDGLASRIGLLAPHMDGETEAEQRATAITMLSAMVGALVLARSVKDQGFSDEILSSVARSLIRDHAQGE